MRQEQSRKLAAELGDGEFGLSPLDVVACGNDDLGLAVGAVAGILCQSDCYDGVSAARGYLRSSP